MSKPTDRLDRRYRIGSALGEDGMATVARFCALLVVACASMGHIDVAAQTVDGMLLDRVTNQPIDQAVVTMHTVDGDIVAIKLTDEAGRFVLEAPVPGDFLLSAQALGYEPTTAAQLFTLAQGARVLWQFRIQPLPIEIGGLTIDVGESQRTQPYLVQNGFVQRVRQGSGRFFTPEDVERLKPLSTLDLLKRSPFVRTRYTMAGGERLVMRRPNPSLQALDAPVNYCTPSVYLNGARVPAYTDAYSLEARVPVSELLAVEVYRSAAVAPLEYRPEFGGDRLCGVIMLWTKPR